MRSSVCCFLPQSSSCQAHLEFSLHFLKGPSESQSCQEQAYSRLHNPTAGCWSSSRAQMLGQRQGRQLCEPTGLARPPRSSPQRGSGSYSPPGYCRTLRGQVGKGLESTPSILNNAEQGFGGGRCILMSKLAALRTKPGI